eukprot:CAMPEP_0203667452 /NCGR_PEP_ID=MMETSP0090-20130426/4285_1 /ASSEMBLY_ACC=CAM_ASM_001088 /TAXON_ID=426623 /ORGANISM="Chaetoceros affinis, Strain CCMP159" /LENGTH=590 /DNA_ID=CAMNT_0050531621 /DNA_START=26 /DNA_END=1798 /DNA_ORIENTATION=+
MVLWKHGGGRPNDESESILVNELSALNQLHHHHLAIDSATSSTRSASSTTGATDDNNAIRPTMGRIRIPSLNSRLARYSTSWLFVSGFFLLVLILFSNYDNNNHHHQEASLPAQMHSYDGQKVSIPSTAASLTGSTTEDGIALQVMRIGSSDYHHQHRNNNDYGHGYNIEYEGKSKRKGTNSIADLFKNTECMKDEEYSSHTVKKIFELPLAGLFKDTKGEKKFEASSIVKVGDNFYAVCDNSWALSKIDASLTPFSSGNVLIGDPNREEEDSGYEAIFHFNKTFYVIRESVEHITETVIFVEGKKHHHGHDKHEKHGKHEHHNEKKNANETIIGGEVVNATNVTNVPNETRSVIDGAKNETTNDTSQASGDNQKIVTNSSFHAIIEELIIDDDESDYKIAEQCSTEFEFEGDSKGFEGAFGMPGSDGQFYIIGLCEGNFCSETRKFDAGNGQMIMMKKTITGSNCIWETVKMIPIPKSAYFRDYSDIEVRPNGKVAITSQEDSQLWVGQLLGVAKGIIDPNVIAFDEQKFDLYDFPKSYGCQTVYCNIEGITFISDEMIMAVSDKMKKHGKQPYWCLEKDQSVHAFILP